MTTDFHGAARALTIHAPWALAIMRGHKRFENRPWLPKVVGIGDRLAIHVSAKPEHYSDLLNSYGCLLKAGQTGASYGNVKDWYAACGQMPQGHIVGTVEIVDLHRKPIDDPWWFGPCAIEVADPVWLDEHVPARGALGCWEIAGRLR